MSPAFILGNVHRLNLIKTSVVHFRESSKKCWDYTKTLVNGLMCVACDSTQQEKFIMDKRKIIINHKQCNEFVENCGEHIKSLNALTFYLTHFAIVA